VKVDVTHTTRLEYTADVVEGVTQARMGPHSDSHQHCQRFELRATPSATVNQYLDGFGNPTHLITVAAPHRYMEIVARSNVETLLGDPFQTPEMPPRPLTAAERADYVDPSNLVPSNPELDFLAAPFEPRTKEHTFEAVQALMELVYQQFEYASQVTTVATTVPEVLAHRRGVCQDFAHVLIGLCRSIGIAARYVSGYIVADPRKSVLKTASAPRGSEASHAWVEAFTDTHGWRGFDPTNNLVASEYHIKMAIGRDYRDVAPTRGTYRGQAAEQLHVQVQTQIEA
jgi:transglutaminase-like putative cysteine protease